MKFVDEVQIAVKAGHGGSGVVSFRREKFIPKGGPDGGNGGLGGNIVFQPSRTLQTLMDLKVKRSYKAAAGDNGRGKNQTGKNGQDTVILVPIGTMIFDESGQKIADLTKEENPFIAAKGGKGGKGNACFATSTNRTPRFAQPGMPGEEKKLKLELRLIAEVGIIGLPNAGKSSLLKQLTKAHPKIAGYPFTTLYPNLGVLHIHDQEIIFADIPGLIEGAHNGAGLGHDFLRHIDRTKILVHLIEIIPDSPEQTWAHYQIIQNELTLSDYNLKDKKQIVVLNKIDIIDPDSIKDFIQFFKKKKVKIWPISAFAGTGVKELTTKIAEVLAECPTEI